MLDPKHFLYISDLDGTLLTPESHLPIEAAERLNHLIKNGLKFTVATARNYDSVYPILRHLKLELPIILLNGVYLTDFRTGQNFQLTGSLSPNVAEDLMTMSELFKLDYFVYTCNEKHRSYYNYASNLGSQRYVDYVNKIGLESQLKQVPHYEFLKNKKIVGMLFIDTYKALKPLHQVLAEKYCGKVNLYFGADITQPDFFWLQIFHPLANKGNMMKKLAKQLKTPLVQTVVFGDYLNDLEMFKIAGRAIAVDNALTEVKEMAHEVIGTNADFAVINYLEQLFFNGSRPGD